MFVLLSFILGTILQCIVVCIPTLTRIFKLVELNRETPIDGIDIGDENSKAYHTGFAGAQNLNNLCSDFSKLREFYIYHKTGMTIFRGLMKNL